MKYPWLYCGAKIVCVNATPLPGGELGHNLCIDRLYVVRWVGNSSHPLAGEYLGVRVEGINRGVCPVFGLNDVPFIATRFRPLHDTSRQIEALKRLTMPVGKRVDA